MYHGHSSVPFSSWKWDGHHLPGLLPSQVNALLTSLACHVLVPTSCSSPLCCPWLAVGPDLPSSRLGKLLKGQEAIMARATCTLPGLILPGQPWAWHCVSWLRLPINPINQHSIEVLMRALQVLVWWCALCFCERSSIACPQWMNTLGFAHLHRLLSFCFHPMDKEPEGLWLLWTEGFFTPHGKSESQQRNKTWELGTMAKDMFYFGEISWFSLK